MTSSKPKTTRKKTITPREPKKRYTSFYLFMLVIGLCIAISSFATIADIPRLGAYYVHSPVFVSLMLLNYVAMAVEVVGLVYLFKKKHIGLVLTIGTLVAQFFLSLALLFFIDQMVAYTVALSNPSDFAELGGKEAFMLFMKSVMVMAIPLGMAVTVGLIVAWHFAWQKQYQADHLSSKR